MSLKDAKTSTLYAMKANALKKGQTALYDALDREIKRRERAKDKKTGE